MWYTSTLSISGNDAFLHVCNCLFSCMYKHVRKCKLVFLLDIYFNNCYFPLAWIISNANTNRKKHKLSLKICYVIEILTCDGYFNDKKLL